MKVIYVGQDDWSRNLYKSTKTNYIYVEVNGKLYTRSAEPWCEPESPLVALSDIEIIEEEKQNDL